MSNRDDGFPIADVSTVLLDDAKMRKLARLCPDDGELAASIVVYMATLLGSWREGRRLTAIEAESWVEPTDERLVNLHAVGLIDVGNRIPSAAWERHFRPAWERREAARAAGRKGAARRWGSDSDPTPTDGDPIAEPKGTDGGPMPDKPTVLPTVSPSVLPSSSPSHGNKKNGSKNETEEERYARYRLLQDDMTATADQRHAAKTAVEVYEAQHRAN